MLKIIKNIVCLSFFIYSFVFPMRQVAQVALRSIVENRQVAQILAAKKIELSSSFHNSLLIRCPIVDAIAAFQENQDSIKNEEIANDSDKLVAIDSLDVSKGHLRGIRIINKNTAEGYINLSPGSNIDETMSSDIGWNSESIDGQFSSFNDNIQARFDYNNKQADQHLSEMTHRVQLEKQAKTSLEKVKSTISTYFSDFKAIVQDEISKIVDFNSLSSSQEIANKQAVLAQKLCSLEKQFAELIQQNPKISFIADATKDGFYEIPYYIIEQLTDEEHYLVFRALGLKAEIEAIKTTMQECNWRIRQFGQQARDFVTNLEKESIETLEKEIMPDLMEKNQELENFVVGKKNQLNDQSNKLKNIEQQLEFFDKKTFIGKRLNRSTINALLVKHKIAKAEQLQTSRDFQLLSDKQKTYSDQIGQVQEVISEKKLQETQFLEKQEQERLASYQKMVQDQHDRCDFDILNSPGHEVKNRWNQRQEALSKTIEQNYVQYYQEYQLTPQAEAFLAIHGVDSKNLKTFFGTALQQQLHGEMCDIFSKAATMQAQFPYQNDLLTSVVNFADAAHDANKNNQILLASQLLDVDCYLLKLNHQIIDAVTPYAQAVMYNLKHSVTDLAYMAAHPLETCKGLGKALYYVLETASLNDPELGSYEQLRDQRSEEIIAGLNLLGEKIANSTGPERFGALVGLAADIVIPEKILVAVGEVCGFVKTQAKVMRTLEGVASIAEEQGLTQELIQATEKLKVATQENIAKNLATELIEADKNIVKSAERVTHKQTKNRPKEVDTRSLLDKNLEIAENAIKDAERIVKLPDGRIRYYEAETPSSTPGRTRGSSYVTEYDPNNGIVRSWYESYDHTGKVNRVHPKMINGKNIDSLHYPHTGKELEKIAQMAKDKK